jgi:hypothetical protein
MSNIDLLNTVLASDGYYCIVGIKNKKVKPFFYTAREDLDAKADELVKSGQDVYFALAKFESDVNRKKENVKALKSFWVDIDCGEAKAVVDPKSGRPDGYIDQTTAIEELAKFCKLVGLPIPLLVNSGRGIHAYWPLTRDVTRAEWEPVAERLAELCRIHKFYADPNVFEAARILRIPGTLNFKEDPPLPVEVINEAEPIKFEVFRDTLGVKESVVEVAPRRELTDLGKQLQENLESSFSKIMRRSAEHNGCKQILDCYQNQATLSEPRWFNALSVAKFCRDADSAIHKMSSGHPDYNPSDTEAKIQHIKGPHTCEQFEKNNPGGCEGCPFKGKIGSPISLGKELIMAEPEQESESESIPSNPAFQVPNYPFPFARGKNGGIYFVPEEDDPKLVYEHDIYVTKRMKDPQIGEVFVLRRHLPQDGVEEFLVPASSMVDKKELQRIISSTGVLCRDKPLELLLWMLISMAKDLQTKQRVLHMRLQFGWADNDSKFIIGDREITKDGVFHSPPSSTTQGLAQFLVPKGTIEKWKEVFKLYGKPGLEPNAYAALTAFGAPLLKFTGQKGSIINVIHPSSGTGKTTSLHMCNSVYGAPDRLYATKEDTLNAKITRLGIMNNLPFTCDEITNTTAEDFSTLAYSMSQGRGKDRMMSQTNQLRLNVTSWQTISLCSSNASMYERMAASKARPDGEMMRLLEYKIDYSNAIDVGVAKQMFDHQLMENYGHAGEIYISWLVNNLEEVVNTLQTIQAKIDRELSLTQRERCWSANVAANITGGLIAKQLELIDWDMKGIYKWITSTLVKMRDEVVAPVTDSMAVIGNFVNSHMQNVLVVNGDIDRRSNMATFPVMEPRGELIIRYEPDTKKLFICTKKFKADCDKFQNNYSEIVKDLKARGILLENKIKRMSKGMKLDVPGVIAMTLDASHPDFIDLDPVLHTQEPNNASGEHTVQG